MVLLQDFLLVQLPAAATSIMSAMLMINSVRASKFWTAGAAEVVVAAAEELVVDVTSFVEEVEEVVGVV